MEVECLRDLEIGEAGGELPVPRDEGETRWARGTEA